MLTAQEIRGLYAILPTPAKADAGRLDATDTVDLDETERLVNALIADGCDGLMALGTTGECATLSTPDYERFVKCLLEVVNRRVPVLVGTSALGGHEIAGRMRLITDLGADGTLLGLPMWQPVTTGMASDFYAGLSELFPRTAIMVYANERAFRYAFPDEFFADLARRAPTVTSAKCSRPKDLKRLLGMVQGRINIVPNEMTLPTFYREAPETTTACWATAASMGPTPVIALMRAVQARDDAAVERLKRALEWANEPVAPLIKDRESFAQTNIQIEKTRINAAGYCKAGPVRPPYDELPHAAREAAEECGRRWAALARNAAQGFAIPATVTA